MPPLIVLEVWHKEPVSDRKCGFIGHSTLNHWPIVSAIDEAETFANKVLAEGGASQFLGYLRNKEITGTEGMYIKYSTV